MKNTIIALSLIGFILGIPSLSEAKSKKEAKGPTLETLKVLEGTWTATNKAGDLPENGKVSFNTFGHGNAVEENSFIGTPGGFLTVYYSKGDDVMASHFCSLGNIANLKLTENSTPKKLNFELMSLRATSSPNEPHVHTLVIHVKDKNHIREDWGIMDAEGKMKTLTIDLARE